MPGPPSMVLLTGAGSDLGRGLVRHFLRRGAHVVATLRTLDGGDSDTAALQRLAQHAGGRLHLLATDVADDASLARLTAALRELGRPVDLLINHASMRQILCLDRLDLSPRQLRVGYEILATLRVCHAARESLGPGALVACLATPPRHAAEFGSLSAPPRVSPGALWRSLCSLALTLHGSGATVAVLYPGANPGATPRAIYEPRLPPPETERLAWVIRTVDELVARPPAAAPLPLLLHRT